MATLNKKLLESEKQWLIDLTEKNISSTWSREAWIKATQDYLASQKTAWWLSALDVASERYKNEQTWIVWAWYTDKPTESAINTQEMKTTWDYLEPPKVEPSKTEITWTTTWTQTETPKIETPPTPEITGTPTWITEPPKTTTWDAWLDILTDTASSLKTNLEIDLANLEKQKAWLSTALTETWKLTDEEQKAVLDPYEQFLDKITKLQEINKQASQREQADLKTNYNQTIDRQRKANELALTNAQKIAAITWVGFTSWGIQWIGNIMEEWTQAITDLEQARESMLSKYQDLDAKLDLEYLDTITTIQSESKQALQDRYNSVITQIQKIDADKWKATKEWLLEIKNVVKEYFDVLDKQWNQDYKMMEFNYNSFLNYKKDLREDEKIVRENQEKDLELLKEWDLTWLTDEDLTNIGADMDLDKWAIQWLILIREQQKRKNELEADKFALETKKATEMTPSQKAQYDLDVKKFWLEQAKFRAEQWWTDTETWITPSWNYSDFTYNMASWTKKAVKVDSIAKDSLMTALNTLGKGVIVWDSFRDSARQQALYDKLSATWATVAKPWTSKHEKWLAVDIYGWKDANGRLTSPTSEQVAIMNNNWWFQTAWEDDKWHFEYKWVTWDANAKVKGLTIWLWWTEWERKSIQNEIVKKAKQDWITVEEAKKKLWYKTWDDVEFAKARKEDYTSFKKSIKDSTSSARTTLTLLAQPQTAIWDVASVVGFLKTIDPSSVARESEVESVENARGILDGLSNIFAKAKEWTKLTDTQRKQLKSSIETIVNASDLKYNEYVRDVVKEFDWRWLDASVYIPKDEVDRVKKWKTAKTWTTPTPTWKWRWGW